MVWCFENISFIGRLLKSCLPRFYGNNCEKYCPYPFFGNQCKGKCECRPTVCHHLNGCPPLGKSYPPPPIDYQFNVTRVVIKH